MLVRLDGTGPTYLQIYRFLRTQILKGIMPRGTQLPSTRAIASDLQVARNTVLQAYEQLLMEGYVVGKIGSGTFVADELPEAALDVTPRSVRASRSINPLMPEEAGPENLVLSKFAQRAETWSTDLKPRRRPLRYDFRYGQPDINGFPLEVWRRLWTKRTTHASYESFAYGAPEGNAGLRKAIVEYLSRSRGVIADEDQVLVVNGSQQALDLIARAVLDPGDVVVMEDPGYSGARMVFRAAGANLIAAPVDDQGICLANLPSAAAQARLIYVTPSHQFPTGVIMSPARRAELLAWARTTNSYIIEDDYDSEFRYDTPPVEAVQSQDKVGQVIYLGTFSKTVFPGLRLGYLVAPKHLIAPLRAIKMLADRHTATLQQEVAMDFITEGHFDRLLRRSRRANASRREAIVTALRDTFGDSIVVQGANAGLHVLVWFKNRSVAELPSIVETAGRNGVGVYPVTSYYINQPSTAGLVLGYAALDEDAIRNGIRALARSLAELDAV